MIQTHSDTALHPMESLSNTPEPAPSSAQQSPVADNEQGIELAPYPGSSTANASATSSTHVDNTVQPNDPIDASQSVDRTTTVLNPAQRRIRNMLVQSGLNAFENFMRSYITFTITRSVWSDVSSNASQRYTQPLNIDLNHTLVDNNATVCTVEDKSEMPLNDADILDQLGSRVSVFGWVPTLLALNMGRSSVQNSIKQLTNSNAAIPIMNKIFEVIDAQIQGREIGAPPKLSSIGKAAKYIGAVMNEAGGLWRVLEASPFLI